MTGQELVRRVPGDPTEALVMLGELHAELAARGLRRHCLPDLLVVLEDPSIFETDGDVRSYLLAGLSDLVLKGRSEGMEVVLPLRHFSRLRDFGD